MNENLPQKQKTARTAYLIAGSGAPNFGDELITRAWLDHLDCRKFKTVLDCNGGPKVARDFHALDRRGVTAVRGVKAFANRIVGYRIADTVEGSFAKALHFGLRAFEPGGAAEWPRLKARLRTLESADRIHLSGGGYINSQISPHSAFLIGFVAASAKRFGIPAFATGLGLTPLRIVDAAADLLDEAIRGFELFEVRDTSSHRTLWRRGRGAPGLVMGLDDSWLLPAEAERDGRRRLHLSFLQALDKGGQAALYDAVAELAGDFDEIVEWNCAPRLRSNGRRAVEARLGRSISSIDCGELTYRPIPAAPGDVMISQRFHPHLIAARLGVAGSYELGTRYYEDKHLSIVQLGSGWHRFAGAAALRNAASAAQRLGPESIVARDSELHGRKLRLAEMIYGT